MAPIESVRQIQFVREVDRNLIHSAPPEMSHNRDLMGSGDTPWTQTHTTSLRGGTTGSGMSRTKSVFAMPLTEALSLSSISGSSSESLAEETTASKTTKRFGHAMRDCVENGSVQFGARTRKVMEPFLRQARSLREMARSQTEIKVDAAIAGSVGVPYTALRHERPFLFDEHTYPLHSILARTLNVPELSRVHEVEEDELLKPLLHRENREPFQLAYDNFVTSFCLPLLHSIAIAKNLFAWASPADRVTYRYQAFPTIRIARPGCQAEPPRCGSSLGHSIGCIFFHIPLTPSIGDSSVFVESHPGREDWHPLQAKSVGLGYVFDGARCLQFSLENTGAQSRVSLDFCVLLYREGSKSDPLQDPLERVGDLCSPEMLNDSFSAAGPGYYEEAFIELGRASRPGKDAVVRKSGTLVDPDYRFGHPF